jgi:putative solute:sodium symporter small subunit
MEILKSASKIVFILLALTACVGFFLGKLESKDFMVLAGMAFTFYFSNKGSADPTQSYLGK